jgi:RsiW-degrading membrane proteinase PrsW (M82 family)
MKRVDWLLYLVIILTVIVFVLIIFYYMKSTNEIPHTKVFLTNTSILGKVLGA